MATSTASARKQAWGGDAGIEHIQPSPRVAMLRERNINLKGRVGYEASLCWTQAFKESEGEPPIVRRAKAIKKFLENKSLPIYPGELIVGGIDKAPLTTVQYPDMNCTWMESELDIFPTRKYDPLDIDEETKKVFKEEILPYWKGKTFFEMWQQRGAFAAPEAFRVGFGKCISEHQSIAFWTVNHFIPDYTRVMKKGIVGIKKDVEERLKKLDPTHPDYFQKATFYKALLMVCDAVGKYGKRYAQQARKLAAKEKDPQVKADYLKVAEVCDQVPAKPARNFHEAVQALYFMWQVMLNDAASIGFGRLDQYLYSYYKKDLEAGTITEAEAQELLDCLFIKCSELQLLFSSAAAEYAVAPRGANMLCVGGVDENGFDATNDLSYMLLQSMCNVRLGQPSVSVLWHANMPEDLAIKACELASLGTGHPSIFSMDRIVEMLQDMGLSLKEARKGSAAGCVEVSAEPGKCNSNSNFGYLNLGVMMEFALNKGVWRMNNEQMGYPTEDPRTFTTFDQVMEAFRKQIAYLVRQHVTCGHIIQKLHAEIDPDPVADLLYEDCIENGTDLNAGGARYNFGPGILFTGVADIINSMAAIKYLIFDKKTLTWDELLKALENNFEGPRGEEIYQMCLKAPKFGNGDPYVDSIGREMMRLPGEETAKYKSLFGSPWRASIIPLTTILPFGMVTGALPSGRKAGQGLAEGCSPKQGTDVLGPTAAIRSVTALDHSGFLNGTQLNMKFTPSTLKDSRGLMNLAALIKTYINRGGHHVQFNIISKETMLDAQKHPENYKGLLVRVSGYNSYFTMLSKELQDDIIARTEHSVLA